MARPRKLKPKQHERAWHTGTIREVRPGVWRAWRARVHNPDGTMIRPSRTFTGPQAAAQAALWAKGEPQATVMLLGVWLSRWLALRRPTISHTTYKLYETAVLACAPLGGRPLTDITVAEWQTLTNSLLLRWSRYHVYVWKGNITTALRAAMPEHLAVNPLERVKLPKAIEAPPKAWTQAEVDRLLSAVEGTPHEAWVLFSLGTGVRLGEARGLLWSDINLTTRTALIRRSMHNSVNLIGPTKTGKVRTVDFPDEIVPILRAHQMRQPPGELLAFGHNGGAYRPSTLRLWLARRCKAAGIPALPPHSFRHSYASLAIDAGVPITEIARQLGHTVQTCQTAYLWFLGEGQRRAANALGAALRNRFSGPKRGDGAKIGS